MSIPVQNIIRSATRTKDDPLNILWLPKDGVFESLLFPHLPHKFYGGHDVETSIWDTIMFPPSSNFYTLAQHNAFPFSTEFDLIVCNNRMKQAHTAKILSNVLHIPFMLIEHNVPITHMKIEDIHIAKNENKANIEVVCDNKINESWKTDSDIIPYGIPNIYKDNYKNRTNNILLVGKFPDQDYNIVRSIQQQSKLPIKVLGDNPTLSKPCTYNDLIHELQQSKYYLNISTYDGIPPILLLALSAGCIPISNKNPLLKNILNKDNSYQFDDIDKLYLLLDKISKVEYTSKSIQANKTIMDTFPLDKFVKSWTKVFDQFYNWVYTR